MPESSAPGSAPTSRSSSSASSASSHGSARKMPSWATLAALLIAVIALVLAIIGWFRPSTGPGKFSDQQSQDAKTSMCAVTGTVRQAVGINTNLVNPDQGSAIGGLAVAANARLALSAGGAYLRERLDAQPATPQDLSNTAAAMANTLQELSINYLAGASPSDAVQQPLRDELNAQIGELDKLCQ